MSLLAFARGPALSAALIVFLAGLCWRALALLLERRLPDPAPPRPGAPPSWVSALSTTIRRSWPAPAFRAQAMVPTLIAYAFHLGWLILLLGGTPHILFFAQFLGGAWPGLPKGVIDVVGAVTLAALLFALWRRVSHPVRALLSGLDDYLTWLVTALPVITGLWATSGGWLRYETLLALHILSVALFLGWFPFGKLMHAVLWLPSRAATGIRYGKRGART